MPIETIVYDTEFLARKFPKCADQIRRGQMNVFRTQEKGKIPRLVARIIHAKTAQANAVLMDLIFNELFFDSPREKVVTFPCHPDTLEITTVE